MEDKKTHRERRQIEQVLTTELEENLLPKEIDELPLQRDTVDIVNNIVTADNLDDLKSYTNLFNIAIAKKNALRIVKLNNLLDAVNDQAIDRFLKRPGEFNNKELLEYMKTVAEQVERSQKALNEVEDKPAIQINNQKNEVNINVTDDLSRESRERVTEVIRKLLQQATTTVESQKTVEEPENKVYNTVDTIAEENK